MKQLFVILFAEAGDIDFQGPSNYIAAIFLAAIAAFGGLVFIISAACGIWILVRKQVALAAGDQKKVQEANKALIGLIITMVIAGVITPLCGVFAASLMPNTDTGLPGAKALAFAAKGLISYAI